MASLLRWIFQKTKKVCPVLDLMGEKLWELIHLKVSEAIQIT